jgi:hypothetical protein
MGGMTGKHGRGLIIDQDGREVAPGPGAGVRQPEQAAARSGFQGRFDQGGFDARAFQGAFGGANGGVHVFGFGGPLTREQRIARLEALAQLLDVAFIMPGTNIRYGIDGLIGLIPVVGDLITTAISLWIVREARALGAPWHVTARMLGNVAIDGTIGLVPLAGDAFDVMFRANMRNIRLLRRWLDRQR